MKRLNDVQRIIQVLDNQIRLQRDYSLEVTFKGSKYKLQWFLMESEFLET